MALTLFENIGTLLTLEGAGEKKARRVLESDLGLKEKHSLLIEGSSIAWVGPHRKIPKEWAKKKIKTVSAKDWTILPGWIESHTHLVFAGSRAEEFELRLQGHSYQEISRRGGGILSTVRATREANSQELLTLAQDRVNRFVSQGVTSLEVKSGYGLNLRDEVKCLEVACKLKGPEIFSTFLGAHALPPENQDQNSYLDYLSEKVLPVLAKKNLCRRLDIFIENGFFSSASARKYLRWAQSLGFQVTIHADQLSLSGGSDLAVELGALSADHLLKVKEENIERLALSEVTANLLPVADIYMKCPFPPARKMIDAGVRVSLATDFNPGTCPSLDLSLVGLTARLEMKMTLPEVIAAYTVGAAHALGIENKTGTLKPGMSADFLCTEAAWTELFYSPGFPRIVKVFARGKEIHS